MDEAPALRAARHYLAVTNHSETDLLFAPLTAPILPQGNFHEISTVYVCMEHKLTYLVRMRIACKHYIDSHWIFPTLFHN